MSETRTDSAPPQVEAEPPRRRADDREPEPAPPLVKPLRVAPGSRTENVIAAFLFAILLGCAGIWWEHNRCPGALLTAATAAAPLAIAAAVPIAGLLAMADKRADRRERTMRGVVFALWAGAASLSLTTALLLALNERGNVEEVTRNCLIARRETVPAPNAGVRDWILVLQCSDRMSHVRIDVDRATWWENVEGGSVEARLARGSLGYEWVIDVPGLGPPLKHLPEW